MNVNDETIDVFRGDVLEKISNVNDSSADLAFIDYPFDIQDDKNDYIKFVEDTVKAADRVTHSEGNIFVINNPHNIYKTMEFFTDKFQLRNFISLVRPASFHPAHHFGFQHNIGLVLYKGDVRENWFGASENHETDFQTDVIEYQNSYRGEEGFHPQAISEELANVFARNLCPENGNVVDFFCGSGTVAVSCRKNNRNYTGFEYDEDYYEMAVKRINSASVIQKQEEGKSVFDY